jgi:hypothetical protein
LSEKIPDFNLHLIISHFDDVQGPSILTLFPKFDPKVEKRMNQIVSYLLDINSVRKDWKWNFTYIDREFCSQNMSLNLPTPFKRSKTTDFLLTLIIHPYHAIFAKEFAINENYVSMIERSVLDSLLDYLESETSENSLNSLIEALQIAQFDIADTLNDEISEVNLSIVGPKIVIQLI